MDKLEAVEKKVAEVMDALPGYEKGISFARLHRVLTEALSAIPDERAAGIREGLEMAAKACEAQQQVFGSTQYATGQPWSSFGERFACGKCAEEIRALKDSHPTPDAV